MRPHVVDIWDAGGYELAEGARVVGDRLVFVDILTGRLLEAPLGEPGPARSLLHLDVPLGAVAPVANRPGRWIAAAGTGFALVSATGALEWLARPEDGGTVATRMNDGACDAQGRFWAGSMAYDATPGAGSLYRLDRDGAVECVLDGLTVVNGPAFDSAGTTMYVADTPTGRIHQYRLDTDGSISSGDIFVEVAASDGSPDGMTVDDDGRLWVALWGGGAVRCYDTDGVLVQTVPVPARQPTSVCLGTAGAGRLFVTTAAHQLTDPSPGDGALLSVRVAASAPPARAFAAQASS